MFNVLGQAKRRPSAVRLQCSMFNKFNSVYGKSKFLGSSKRVHRSSSNRRMWNGISFPVIDGVWSDGLVVIGYRLAVIGYRFFQSGVQTLYKSDQRSSENRFALRENR